MLEKNSYKRKVSREQVTGGVAAVGTPVGDNLIMGGGGTIILPQNPLKKPKITPSPIKGPRVETLKNTKTAGDKKKTRKQG